MTSIYIIMCFILACIVGLKLPIVAPMVQEAYDLEDYGSKWSDYPAEPSDGDTDSSALPPPIDPVSSCLTTVTKKGSYLIDSSVVQPWHMSMCLLYIRAPLGQRVRIQFSEAQLNCEEQSHIIAVDGWLMINWFSGQRRHIPWFRERHVHSVCAQDGRDNEAFASSTNVAQVLYSLQGAFERAVVTVDFMADSSLVCDQVVDLRQLANQTVRLTAEPGRACRLFVSGGIEASLRDVRTETGTTASLNCHGSQTSGLSLRSAASGWTSSVHLFYKCDLNSTNKRCDSIKSPCSNNVLELEAGCAATTVVLKIDHIRDEDREPNAYYCSKESQQTD